MRKPASLNLPGTRTRFDEFQAIHQLQAYATHYVGAFLPFHRAMLYAHEVALRSECNYTDWQPYWEEQLDAGHFMSSAVLHDFGGPGSGTTDCITSGPFANYTNHLGPGYEYTEHCVNRQINETMSALSAQEQVDICLSKKDWLNAWTCIEDSPHVGGHGGVGGLVS
jgi:tyrosinase